MAIGLVTNVMHQPIPYLKAIPLRELFTYASLAAAINGKEFK